MAAAKPRVSISPAANCAYSSTSSSAHPRCRAICRLAVVPLRSVPSISKTCRVTQASVSYHMLARRVDIRSIPSARALVASDEDVDIEAARDDSRLPGIGGRAWFELILAASSALLLIREGTG